MASGWNLWAWLQCIGVASPCCCKELYRYPQVIKFPYSYTPLVLGLFWQQHPYFFLHLKNVFSVLFPLFFTIYSKRYS